MPSTVITVENLSKYYRLGLIGGGTLREDVSRWIAKIQGKSDPLLKIGEIDHDNRKDGQIWALKDVNFEVQEGEILGIIGRNGAGKSTLLKILSRITAPTEGRITIRGRVGSLLEVGTGFHPELTGRENIYLNGTILGMKKTEVDRKLEEIVEFAEIAQFIDTPVKRYSSGMTVRLAFAVAAHLKPEILIVDEVLAVGDAAFQKKCLGKMQDVAGHGRTVLFVSHNMQSIRSLCSSCVLFEQGLLTTSNNPDAVINEYLLKNGVYSKARWTDEIGVGNHELRLKVLEVSSSQHDRIGGMFPSKDKIHVKMEVWLKRPMSGLCMGFDLLTGQGETVFRAYDTDVEAESFNPIQPGRNILTCTIPSGLLNGGQYLLAPRIGIHNKEWILNGDPLVNFSVNLDHGVSPFWNALNENNRPGVIAPVLNWTRFSNP